MEIGGALCTFSCFRALGRRFAAFPLHFLLGLQQEEGPATEEEAKGDAATAASVEKRSNLGITVPGGEFQRFVRLPAADMGWSGCWPQRRSQM